MMPAPSPLTVGRAAAPMFVRVAAAVAAIMTLREGPAADSAAEADAAASRSVARVLSIVERS